jgi:hypothetical protein
MRACDNRCGLPFAALGALGVVLLLLLAGAGGALAQPSKHPFEIEAGSFKMALSTGKTLSSAGEPDYQAGAHADWTFSFDFAHNSAGQTFNDLKDTVINVPAGFMGNANKFAFPTCTAGQLVGKKTGEPECPPGSQVGTISLDLTLAGKPVLSTFPVYFMEVNSFGVTAEFGFNAITLVQVIPITVRPEDSGITSMTPDSQDTGEAHNVSVTIWGLPAAKEHDPERGRACYEQGKAGVAECKGGGQEANVGVAPFLANPTSCGMFTATMSADSWEEPLAAPSTASAEVGPIAGCERVHFDPSLKVQPTTNAAESPTGLDFSMDVPQSWDSPFSLATSNLKDASVTLPAGMSLNPSAGSGLGSCTEAQFAAERFDSLPGEGCPPESKVGSVEVETPVLTEKALGSVYVAKPFHNPFGSLLALYVTAKIPSRGIIVKVAGQVHADPLTGQLTTTFLDNPQVPFNKFTLKFRQGATSPLISPPACGTYTAAADLTPWSAPLEPRHLTTTFPVETGVHSGPCPSGGTPPFHPGLVAGTQNNLAGSYSPFYIRLSRQDGEQEITHFSIKLPPGVIGKLAGIPFCSDAQVAQALSRSHEGMAALEEADPSCPAASQVGRTLVEAGVGSVLAQAPGKIYLAGPYHGSAISVVAITNAKVGPFDLGTVVVREALKVNPETAEVFVDATGSDPLPHIVDGIPTHLRQIRIYMNRPEFVLNPTSCEPTSTASTVLGSGLDFASEADDQPVTVSSPFQAADCAALPFKPKLKLRLLGGTRRGAHPALKATLRMNGIGEAAISRAQVTLPKSEFLENAHIRTICTRVQFKAGVGNGAACPAGSIYGFARATTPILSEPLEGPVYLRSSEHQLPDLVAALHSGEINIDLVGRIDSLHGQIRNTFEAVPDAPVTSFTLEMQGGGKGLLVNSTNLCASKHHAIADFTGHNGKVHDFTPALGAKCPRPHKKGKHGHKRHHRRGARR